MQNQGIKVQPTSENGNDVKPIVMRGCDLKGKGSMLALSLTYANAGYKGEFTLDAEFVKALLKEYTDVTLPTHNLV